MKCITPRIRRKAKKGGTSFFSRKRNDAPMFFQPKLSVGPVDDVYEREADAVASRIMDDQNAVTATGAVSSDGVQRKCAECEEEEKAVQKKDDGSAGDASTPTLVEDVLESNGQALDSNAQSFMESRFGYDFSNVRIHNDDRSAESADSIHALAYTSGNDIVFNEGAYSPDTTEGQKLLAHELTHVVQQNAAEKSPHLVQRQEDEIELEFVESSYEETLDLHNRGIDLPPSGPAPPVRQQAVTHGSQWSRQRRRQTKRAPGFTGDTSGTYIHSIEVTIKANGTSTASLHWANMGNSPGYVLPATLDTSPGAGTCAVDCSDVAQSQQNGSHCTPLSPPTYTVQGFSSHLASYPTATFVTWYHYDRGIAFHYFNVPAFPASHGCTRMDHGQGGAEWIYDNSLPGITTVTVTRDASQGAGPRCWRGESLIQRPRPRRP